MKSTSTQNLMKVKNDDLEDDLKLVIEKYEQGSKPVLDLINLFEEYDGNSRWKIMSQICSYTILFKESSSLLVSVEQFMMLINDKSIANSDIITVRNEFNLINCLLYFFNLIFFVHHHQAFLIYC